MDRRNFLRSMIGVSAGVVASATMADVGFWAEPASWLQRKPTYFIPAEAAIGTAIIGRRIESLTYTDIDAITIKYLSREFADNFFTPSPLFIAAFLKGPIKLSSPRMMYPITGIAGIAGVTELS